MTQPSTTISALIVRYVNGIATPEEKRHLEDWASESAENRSWLEKFSDADWLQKQSIIHNNIDLDERCKTFWAMVAAQQARKGKVLPMVQSMANIAAVCIVAFTAWFFFVSPEKETNQNATVSYSTSWQRVFTPTYIDSFSHGGPYSQAATYGADNGPLFHKLLIPAGGFMEVALPDGSRAWLNSMTTFVYPHAFTGNKRKVEITGEAYFEVEPNADTPFLAIVNGIHIETSGGRFHVKAYEEEAGKKATVLEGAVRVSAGPYDVPIKANQSALVKPKKRIAILFNEDTAKVMAWKDRQFLFIDDSLAVVARELARRYGLKIKYKINSKAMIYYSGSRLEALQVVLRNIQLGNAAFHFKMDGRYLIFE